MTLGWIDLYNKEGQLVSLEVLGLLGLRLGIPSPSYEIETETIEGMDGEIVVSQKLNPRTLTAFFWSKSSDYQESLRNRNQIYGILGNGQEYYVAESNVPGKRWLVRMEQWDPQRINSKIQEFEIPLVAKSGKSESVNIIKRSYTNLSFGFYNGGTVPIDMRAQNDTEITFTGASNGLSIRNLTTGDVWTYEGTTTITDVITLKGVRSLKNNSSIFGQTNKQLLSFAVGNNEIEVSGASGEFKLTISTRFYFL